MLKHQQKVREFMQKAGQETPDKPKIPSRENRYLRAKLILEEAIEAIDALGFDVLVDGVQNITEQNFNKLVKISHRTDDIDINNLAKELADMSVVGPTGTATAFGIDIEPILDLVDDNNLAKFGPGSYKNEYGKHCKPPNHPKPHELIKVELAAQTHLK